MNRFYGEYIGVDMGSVNSLGAFMDGIARAFRKKGSRNWKKRTHPLGASVF